MLIPLEKLIKKYKLTIRGVLHIGAHLLEEQADYLRFGINKIIWIEGNPQLYQKIYNQVDHKDQLLFNQLISDVDGGEVAFHIANNAQASSILQFRGQEEYPEITFVQDLVLKTKTLRALLQENNIDIASYNFINLDIQGVELRALKGLGPLLNKVDYIYTEVNVKQVYQNNDLMEDMDVYLHSFGFKRIETKLLEDKGWGDAFYAKNITASSFNQSLVETAYMDTSNSNFLLKLLRRVVRLFVG